MEVQNFEMHFLEGWGGSGRSDKKNMFGGKMKLIFSYGLGSHFYQFVAFYGQGTDLENIFGVAKFQIFLGMPDIPDTFGDKE